MPYLGGLYSGVEYTTAQLNQSGASAIDEQVRRIIADNKSDSIVGIVIMPDKFVSAVAGDSYKSYQYIHARPTTIDGYSPRNKKLFTHPYCFLCADSLNDSKTYRYELVNGANTGEIHFNIAGGMSMNPEIVCYPVNYNGAGTNASESLTLNGFPQCAVPISSYNQWLATESRGQIISLAAQGISSATTMLSGNVVGGVLGSLGMASQLNNMTLDATKGSKTRGTQGASTDVATGLKGIYFKNMCMTAQYARIADDFMDRFGYTTNRLKVPNRNVRPHWTYTKTRDCAIRGSIPVDAMTKIKTIYNNGVTFWKNGSEVGNYALNNSI